MNPAQPAARLLLPKSVRAALRQKHRDYKLARALEAVVREPVRATETPSVLDDLVYGWGNEGWSAHGDYLRRMVTLVSRAKADTIECGSGLSTLLLGAAARASGTRVWSLEHTPAWRARVIAMVKRYGLENVVTVADAPIRKYDGFDWYTVPPEFATRKFGVAVCDGPPSDTRGGRYGLLPVLREQFVPGAVILLDDAARPEEQQILARWAAETSGKFTIARGAKPYGEFVLP